MERKNQFSEDVIRIFHNAKGSVRNKIKDWNDSENEHDTLNAEWNTSSESPFNHAAGEYEPLLSKDTAPISETNPELKTQSNNESSEQTTPAQVNHNAHSEDEIDDQIGREQRILLEGARRADDIQEVRSSHEGFIGDSR